MYNPIMMEAVGKARQADLLRQAEERRLARLAMAASPQPTKRGIPGLKALLTGANGRLNERQAPARLDGALKRAEG